MKVAWITLVTALLTGLLSVPAAALEIEGGSVEGSHENGTVIYRGIPYAAPPVGDLRWRPPAPVVAWEGTRQTTEFAPACMQNGVSMPGEAPPSTGEDCLYLNIWRPDSAETSLPVFVWIHGGGWTNGATSMPLYWGDRLAQRGIIVVTIAYRLGAFGFLAHPELTAESGGRTSGNCGLMDQIAALEWVKRNIASFGGDPSRVTIGGQSAGSMSVSILMASPLAAGLFHGAIGQSGGFFEPVQLAPHYLLGNAERDGEAFAASAGAHSIAELRRLPAEAILAADASRIAHPVLDGHVLAATPFEVFAAGKQAHVPLLIGSNAEEARAFTDPSGIDAGNFHESIASAFGPLPPDLIAPYPVQTTAQARESRIAFETDLRFGWNMSAWARLHAETGESSVYLYRFERQPPFPAASPYAGWGAAHFAELWYMFDHLGQADWQWQDADHALAETMANYWTSFIKTGNPNDSRTIQWPAFAAKTQELLILDGAVHTGVQDRPAAMAAFDAVYGALRGSP